MNAPASPALLEAAAEHDLAHLNSVILPWWYANGVDDELGGVLTCFDNAGSRLSSDKYTWSQGRWAWLMGRVALAGEAGVPVLGADRARERAARSADFLAAHALLADGRTAYQTTRAGDPVPQAGGALHTSVYADLFAVLGFAGAAASAGTDESETRRQGWIDAAETILSSASRRVRDRTAASEPYPVPDGMRSLGQMMMMVSAAAELVKVSGSEPARRAATDWAQEACALVDESAGALPPDFAAGRRGHPGDTGSLVARHRTPGHVLELLWFLLDAADAVPGLAGLAGPWMADLAVRAFELGWDEESGGLFRYVDRDGGAPAGTDRGSDYERLVRHTWSTKLWWPHAEALYASALLASRYDSPALWDWHQRVREYTFATFPLGPGGEWAQIRDREGRPLDEVVALPVKDPFHIGRALLLSAQLPREEAHHR